MHELLKNLMTEEEFNGLLESTRMALEDEARKAERLGYLDWHHLTRYVNFTEDEIRKFIDRIDWAELSFHHYFSEEFIDEFKDKLVWADVSQFIMFTKSQLIKYIDYIDWDRAPTYQSDIDEEVIDTVMASSKKDEFNWHGALVKIRMSEAFLEKYADLANKWDIISYYQDLSERFIEKYADKLNWNYIAQKQHLSRQFMVKHYNKLNPLWLAKYQKNWDNEVELDYKRATKPTPEKQITDLVQSVYSKYTCIKVMEGDGTYDKPYQIVVLDLAIENLENTIVLEDKEYNFMNVTALTKKISDTIHNAGFRNFKLYMVPKN